MPEAEMAGKSMISIKENLSDAKSECLENFNLLKTVGTGTFSRVYLCQKRQSSKYYAVKILPINDVIRHKQVQHVRNEKEVLKKIKHPFLISLADCWKDSHNLYFLFPFHCGGELFTYMRMYDRLSASFVRFYSAEIVSALSYLHNINIAYRDLKPENILLDREGHTIITDFGFSKMMTGPSWTMCGTPEYLAPEILQGKSHNKAVDWWSLGILMYEMLIGQPPFIDSSLMGLYEKIIACNIDWKEHLANIDDNTKDFIQKLLQTDEKLRLGSGCGGPREIQDHKYFSGINWSDVQNKCLPPPLVPNVNSDEDTRYFNFYQENDINIEDFVNNEHLQLFKDF